MVAASNFSPAFALGLFDETPSYISWGLLAGLYIVIVQMAFMLKRTKNNKRALAEPDPSQNSIDHNHEEERLRSIAENSFEAVCIAFNGKIFTCNQALADLLKTSVKDLIGTDLIDYVAPDYRQHANDSVRYNATTAKPLTLVDSEGLAIACEVRGRRLDVKDKEMRIISVRDMRQQAEIEKQIRHMAMHDSLTGLANRALFQEEMVERMAKREDGTTAHFALMLLDLDRFKDINDIHGHLAGDEVIRQTGARLTALSSEGDRIARLGGDEFAMVVDHGGNMAHLEKLAGDIVRSLEQPFALPNGEKGNCGASIGVSLFPRDADTTSGLMSRADTALYKVKKAGRNGFCIFEPGMDEAEKKRILMKEDLSKALEKDRFEIYVQPQADLRTNSIYGFECLLRWRDPVRGYVSPADFIPVAEDSQLIIPIGRWVLDQAISFAKQSEESLSFSVNVSSKQFKDAGFADYVEGLLSKANLDPSRLELEITETSLVEDDERAIRVIEQLKEIGVQMSLDDFGTGYSSMSYLAKFPFDRLKIDRTFMSGAIYSAKRRAIVKAMIEVGKALNMRVIAEGVETRDELDFLKSEGCDEAQGFLFGKPALLEDALKNLEHPIAASHRLRSQEEIDRLVDMLRNTHALAG